MIVKVEPISKLCESRISSLRTGVAWDLEGFFTFSLEFRFSNWWVMLLLFRLRSDFCWLSGREFSVVMKQHYLGSTEQSFFRLSIFKLIFMAFR